MATPDEQALLAAERRMGTAKKAFDAADLELTNACKALADARKVVETFVPDFTARCSR